MDDALFMYHIEILWKRVAGKFAHVDIGDSYFPWPGHKYIYLSGCLTRGDLLHFAEEALKAEGFTISKQIIKRKR